jgi:hypothetical protein
MKKKKTIKKEEKVHDDLHGLKIECEECGGEVEIVNASYPNSYECACKKCNHRFNWVEPEEKH